MSDEPRGNPEYSNWVRDGDLQLSADVPDSLESDHQRHCPVGSQDTRIASGDLTSLKLEIGNPAAAFNSDYCDVVSIAASGLPVRIGQFIKV